MISIPGDILEGGGQILRTSVALSSIGKKPLKIFNIRAKRSPPGLRGQHLNAVKAVAMLADAEVEGLKIGSRAISFLPRNIKGKSLNVDIGTAGSSNLVLQALMPLAAFAPSRVSVEIRGGTNNPKAPPTDYIRMVMLPTIAKMGFKGSVNLLRRGFFPRGQGIIRSKFEPVKRLMPILLTSSAKVKRLFGLSYSSRLPSHIVERMAKSAKTTLSKNGHRNMNIELEILQPNDSKCAVDSGCGIILLAELTSGSILYANSIGKIGKSAEKVGEEAATNLLKQLNSGAPVDKYLADQIIVYMSLADGVSKIRTTELTLHTLTCIEINKRILGTNFSIEGELGNPATITCKGISLENRAI